MSKRYRHTKLKQKLIDAYKERSSNFFEYGTPPYNAALLAETADADLSNALKSLKTMVEQGIFTTEKAKQEIWNAIAGRSMPKLVICYWLTETLEQDKQKIAAHKAHLASPEHQEYLDGLFKKWL